MTNISEFDAFLLKLLKINYYQLSNEKNETVEKYMEKIQIIIPIFNRLLATDNIIDLDTFADYSNDKPIDKPDYPNKNEKIENILEEDLEGDMKVQELKREAQELFQKYMNLNFMIIQDNNNEEQIYVSKETQSSSDDEAITEQVYISEDENEKLIECGF